MSLNKLNEAHSRLKKYIEKIEQNRDWKITKEDEDYINSGTHNFEKQENKEMIKCFAYVSILVIIVDVLKFSLYDSLYLMFESSDFNALLGINVLIFGGFLFFILSFFRLMRIERKLNKGNKKLFRLNFVLEKKELEFHYEIIQGYLENGEIAKIMKEIDVDIIGRYEAIDHLYYKAKQKAKNNLKETPENRIRQQLKLLNKGKNK